MDLENLMELMAREHKKRAGYDESAPRPLPEAVIATLREHAANYMAPCPFKPGDLVTVRRGVGIRGAGEPAVVLETLAEPVFTAVTTANNDWGSNGFGARLNVRMLSLSDDNEDVTPHWIEHWRLEAYTGAGVE